MRRSLSLPTLLLTATLALPALAQQPKPANTTAPFADALAGRTTVKVLPNGLTIVISERHEAPVFSFHTTVNVGSVDDPQGQSGLAHMFEHIAFKGTTEIGTKNYEQEKVALANVEQLNRIYETEAHRSHPDQHQLERLKKAREEAIEAAQRFVIPNQFSELAESNGAVGLNASTSEDSTDYFWSMPSNRLELWAYLESSRIGWPVAREFYKERDVVNEERRMRIDSSPQGRLVEEFLAAAYMAHPYGRPGVGWESDITQVTATEAMEFHRKYYAPSNIVVALVGDIDPKTALPLLEKYFGRIPAGPLAPPLTTVEPHQNAERTVVLHEASQPIYIEGYHRPDFHSPDDAVYEAISDIFSNGRTSRLYRSLVRDQRIALAAEGFTGFPGQKYPSMFAFYALPMQGHTNAELADAIHKELDRMKTEDVTDDELARFKASERAALLRSLGDNASLAGQLADYQTRFGDWKAMFQDLADIDNVTKADIRRVAQQTFVTANRTVARIEFKAPTAPQAPAVEGGAR
ncbi:M16 family metallopeptidase [Granulicella cerasi]|nr:pitrilysin family protein [Granulicella cerasi]